MQGEWLQLLAAIKLQMQSNSGSSSTAEAATADQPAAAAEDSLFISTRPIREIVRFRRQISRNLK
jgi:uncharacterized protein YcfJ